MYEESLLSTLAALSEDGVKVDKVSMPPHYAAVNLPAGVKSVVSKDGLLRFYRGSTVVLVQVALS